MNDQPPPSKRQRVDPNAMDDDNKLPPKGQSVLGKRKRKYHSEQYYGGTEAEKVEKGVPPNHPQNANEFMNPSEQKTDNETHGLGNFEENQHIPRVSDFQRGHQLDIKVTDEHQETFWTTGIICKVQDDKVLIHVPRSGPSWKSKLSDDIAPAGTYTDGLN